MLSLCITTYNRFEMTMGSFAQIINDDRISEIVIVDDCSEIEYYDKLAAATIDMPKVRLIRNEKNLGMSLNKKKAIELAKSEWCIIFDSDNVIGIDYLDAFEQRVNNKNHEIIYCPDFAAPNFDYRHHGGCYIDKSNSASFIKKTMAEPLLNTCNYIINRAKYLEVYKPNEAMKGTDTIWLNYLWLCAGYTFYIVPGMQYFHRVHDESGFLADCDYNMKKAKEVKNLILNI